jgi:hypothetical protein
MERRKARSLRVLYTEQSVVNSLALFLPLTP